MRPQDRHRIERGPPIRIQEQSADSDEHNWEYQRSSARRWTVSHCTPLRSLLRIAEKKSSFQQDKRNSGHSIPPKPNGSQHHRSASYARVREKAQKVRGVRRWAHGKESFG